MKAEFVLGNPDDLVAVVTLRATVKDWRDLRRQISTTAWPTSRLSEAIDDLIQQAESRFYAEAPKP
jgi:hypothetical protein